MWQMSPDRLVITADWHLREDMPICRNDADWMDVQRGAMKFVIDFANEKKASVAIVGDLFHRSHVHPSVVSMFLEEVGRYFVEGGGVYLLAGQHDLPYHSLENISKSSFGNLWALIQRHRFDRVKGAYIDFHLGDLEEIGTRLHFGELRVDRPREHSDDCAVTLGGGACDCPYQPTHFVFIHQLAFKSKKDMPPTDEGMLAEDLAAMFPEARIIALGDNHRHFMWETHTKERDQVILNPGCLVRQSADLIDYESGFYYVDEEQIDFVVVPDSGTVSNAHLVREQERDDRIEAFVSTLEKGQEVSLDFVQNLRSKMGQLEKPVVDVLEEMLQEIHGG